MGEKKGGLLRVAFDPWIRLEFHGVKVTSNAEGLAVDPAMRVDQGGEVCSALDAPVLPSAHGQPGQAMPFCLSPQPGQLPAPGAHDLTGAKNWWFGSSPDRTVFTNWLYAVRVE